MDTTSPITDAQIYSAAIAAGWDVYRTSLYDEEGIEGWRWVSPDEDDFDEIGDWQEPPVVPDEVRALFCGRA